MTMMTSRRHGAETAPVSQRLGRVLLLEDEADVAELIRYTLPKGGYDVLLTSTGTDALEMAYANRPDVVLLDILVPELNGWEGWRRLKQGPGLAGIPVLMGPGRVYE